MRNVAHWRAIIGLVAIGVAVSGIPGPGSTASPALAAVAKAGGPDLEMRFVGATDASNKALKFEVVNVGDAPAPATTASVATLKPNPRPGLLVYLDPLDPGQSFSIVYDLGEPCNGHEVKATVDDPATPANNTQQLNACDSRSRGIPGGGSGLIGPDLRLTGNGFDPANPLAYRFKVTNIGSQVSSSTAVHVETTGGGPANPQDLSIKDLAPGEIAEVSYSLGTPSCDGNNLSASVNLFDDPNKADNVMNDVKVCPSRPDYLKPGDHTLKIPVSRLVGFKQSALFGNFASQLCSDKGVGPTTVGYGHDKYADCQASHVYQTAAVFDLSQLDELWALPEGERTVKQVVLHISGSTATDVIVIGGPQPEVVGPGSCVAAIGIPDSSIEGHLGLMESRRVAGVERKYDWDVLDQVEAWLDKYPATPRERGLLLSTFNESLASPAGDGACTTDVNQDTHIAVTYHVGP
jgi:hypothetical protein